VVHVVVLGAAEAEVRLPGAAVYPRPPGLTRARRVIVGRRLAVSGRRPDETCRSPGRHPVRASRPTDPARDGCAVDAARARP
jgi:hypothetical protein